MGEELKVLLVTLGARGAAYVAAPEFCAEPMQWRPRGIVVPPVTRAREAHSKKIPPAWAPASGDPTGCGDVWGATCFCRLLSGDTLDDAMTAANAAAARNVQHRGATGLNRFLQGRIHS